MTLGLFAIALSNGITVSSFIVTVTGVDGHIDKISFLKKLRGCL